MIDRSIERLQAVHSTTALMAMLMPILVLQLLPTEFIDNEFNYFMLSFKRVSPNDFPTYSAAFDASNARIVSEFVIGYAVSWLGYESAHAVLRVAMAVGYAAALAYFFTGIGLSAASGIIVLGSFLLVGPDLMGHEWLFQGVESKTFAYAFVFYALGAIIRGRRASAVAALVLATYFHFLVGGFWLLATITLDVLRDWNVKRTIRLLVAYSLAIAPLAAVILHDQVIAQGQSTQSANGLTANYIYSILRAPHHTAPFSSLSQFHAWTGGIAATLALTLTVVVLLRSIDVQERPLFHWLLALLLYLIAALILSAFDSRTGILGKLYLFRPAALTLFLTLTLATTFLETTDKKELTCRVLSKGLLLFTLPVAMYGIIDDRLTDRYGVRHQNLTELRRVSEFIRQTTEPNEIVLVDPSDELRLNDGAAPFLIDRPTLVSWKFVPTNNRDILRWYDLIEYRRRVFKGACEELGRFPIRYLLIVRSNDHTQPPCGKYVYHSKLYALADVAEHPGKARSPTHP